jgi:carbon storage regulator
MLIMKRRAGESILIGDDIEIHLAHIGRTRVKIGIQAPRNVPVVAKEVQLVGEENRAAAATATLPRLLAGLEGRSAPPGQVRVLEDSRDSHSSFR